jgi:magnesium transporter
MLSAYLYNQSRNELVSLGAADVLSTMPHDAATPHKAPPDARPGVNGGIGKAHSACRKGELLWLDITDPQEEDFQLLVQRFALHPLVIEDMKDHEGRPKLHDYNDYLYIIFHALSYQVSYHGEQDRKNEDQSAPHTDRYGNSYELLTHEIDCLVGSDYVITLHKKPIHAFKDVARRWEAHPGLMRSGAFYLLYELMDAVLDDYFPLLDALDERIDEFEDRLFLEFQEHLSGDIFALKRCLLQIRRIAGPTRDVANVLLRRSADSGGKHFAYFQDLYDHAVRIVDMVDTFRDILSSALDAYLAIASNRMNAVMKTLTLASIILLIPTLIAGIYGMNFDNIPDIHSGNGFYWSIAAMAAIVVGLTVYFKRKGWL